MADSIVTRAGPVWGRCARHGRRFRLAEVFRYCDAERAMAEQRRNAAGQTTAETKRLSALAVDVWGRDGDD